MKTRYPAFISPFLCAALVLGATGMLVAGCDLDSADVVRGAEINVTGRYVGVEGASLVNGNSGAGIARLDLQQRGERLQGVDNNGTGYAGNIRRIEGSVAHIRLDGVTTAGAAFALTGTIQIVGTTAHLHGTWIEANRQGGVQGRAIVAAQPQPEPGPENGDDG